MHPHAVLLTRFYEAFARGDAEAMVACYHPEAAFSDPAFGLLDHAHVCGMWRMLLARARDLRVTFTVRAADDERGEVAWEARYTFSRSGRPVHNIITGQFGFKDGLILAHRDGFDLHAWARQALGWKGALFGGMGWFQRSLQAQARKGLAAYLAGS